MARPQSFNTAEVLDQATTIFWKQGYNNTSLNDLEETTGISRKSIYNSFGNKEKLFLTILDRYKVSTIVFFNNALADRSLSSIPKIYEMFAKGTAKTKANEYGCLMANTIVDVHNAPENIRQQVQEYRALIKDYFYKLLQERKNELKPTVDIDGASELLLTILWGMFSTNRLYTDSKKAMQAVYQVQELLQLWQK